MLNPAPGLDPYLLQRYSMFVLRFSFEGSRNACASRLLASGDVVAELGAAVPVLERLYPDRRVRAVEIAAYDRGQFDYYTWDEGLKILSGLYPHTTLNPSLEGPGGEPLDDLAAGEEVDDEERQRGDGEAREE
jgi:hypothetical protein